MGTLLAGCALAPSDPPPFHFGARVIGHEIQIKIPLCPKEKITSVSTADADDTKAPTPETLWSASLPVDKTAEKGVFFLWSSKSFHRSSTAPSRSQQPHRVDVEYTVNTGDDSGDDLDLDRVRNTSLAGDEFWTVAGPETATQIDNQLKCNRAKSP